jgi:hypothetical protein
MMPPRSDGVSWLPGQTNMSVQSGHPELLKVSCAVTASGRCTPAEIKQDVTRQVRGRRARKGRRRPAQVGRGAAGLRQGVP